jgi:endonuclease/exonuclease/phosphatase family metal-dependent hydrolase
LLPAHTPLPDGTEDFIRPSALRAAALEQIGRAKMPQRRKWARRTNFRLMTYNTHGCGGMDGRVSPRRVARVIQGEMPDIVALQELDLGRRRSRAEDQAAIIARETGMQVEFCPTVTRGEEHYGHAFLSRWPMKVVKRARLPHDPASWWQEPRAAIWTRVEVDEHVINVITTHLGLGARERVLQMEALLGREWIGGIPPDEPVLLCGDFNMMPGSAPYRHALTRLSDVQLIAPHHRPLSTFSSWHPMVRIDHVFASPHFGPQKIIVVRNDLTRVASDHLPLMVDLRVGPSVVDKSTPTHRELAEHRR